MTHTLNGLVLRVLIAPDRDSIVSQARPDVEVTFEGFVGDRHAGLTYRSGGRTPHFPRGTELRNSRQVSLVSAAELAEVAAALDVPEVGPEPLGANLLIDGIPSLTLLPPGTRFYFPAETVLVVENANGPCTTAGEQVQARYPGRDDIATAFPKAAINRRGLVAWVERPGRIRVGDSVRVEVPEPVQYPYP